MPFKRVKNVWVPDHPKFELGTAFSVGDWNLGPGGGRFSPRMRSELKLAQKAALIKKAGASFMEFHDTEAEPKDARRIVKIVKEAGLGIWMCTANLFKRGPEFAGGNFGSPNEHTRQQAINRTKTYIAVGIETYGAQVYVYWNGSNGIDVPLAMDYRGLYERTAAGIAEVVSWMIKTYGQKRALMFALEPKPNEPRGWGVPADVGEALAIIGLLPKSLQPFVGLNPEKCHSQLCGKRFAMELGLAAAHRKLFYVHLNGGSWLKFDEDRAYGDVDISSCVEDVVTLEEIGFDGALGLDVQPLNTDREDQQAASVARSIRNFRRAQSCRDRLNLDRLNSMRADHDQAAIADYFSEAVTGK